MVKVTRSPGHTHSHPGTVLESPISPKRTQDLLSAFSLIGCTAKSAFKLIKYSNAGLWWLPRNTASSISCTVFGAKMANVSTLCRNRPRRWIIQPRKKHNRCFSVIFTMINSQMNNTSTTSDFLFDFLFCSSSSSNASHSQIYFLRPSDWIVCSVIRLHGLSIQAFPISRNT